jgi:EAL domain-containing protein (putative c-di-GMP-specific phosphodiesterase class I)
MKQESKTAGLDFDSGLQRQQIVPYFQPLVDLKSHAIVGFEVLARWSHPERGLLHPNFFISTAERAGLLDELIDMLLERATAAAAQWPDHLSLSINVHPRQLQEPSLPRRLKDITQRNGFQPARLILEVTENAKLQNLEMIYPVVENLRCAGVRFALDDFGAGYSGLLSLQKLPFDEVKIDAGFIYSMAHDGKSRAIIMAVIELSHSLGLATTAEGINNQNQAEMLTKLRCHKGQGWHFGKPLPEDEVPLLVLQTKAVQVGTETIAHG